MPTRIHGHSPRTITRHPSACIREPPCPPFLFLRSRRNALLGARHRLHPVSTRQPVDRSRPARPVTHGPLRRGPVPTPHEVRDRHDAEGVDQRDGHRPTDLRAANLTRRSMGKVDQGGDLEDTLDRPGRHDEPACARLEVVPSPRPHDLSDRRALGVGGFGNRLVSTERQGPPARLSLRPRGALGRRAGGSRVRTDLGLAHMAAEPCSTARGRTWRWQGSRTEA